MDVSQLDLARAQFATTTIYHFFFVPVTIGLGILVAVLHTQWYRTGKQDYRRLTRFFGGLMLLSIAVGVVTGLVQEFQFGMDWSAYSRYVGDVFGAPLAMEGLAAFFLESTFLGLWLFGWKVLPRGAHLATAWLVAVGSMLSAMFILAANSWMQHPVGYATNASTGKPALSSIGDLFTNPVFVWGYLHVIAAALVYGGAVLLAVSAWHLRRGRDVELFHRAAKLGVWVVLVATVLQFQIGGKLGQNETEFQPMKVAAMEAQWETCQPCSFSLAQIGGYNTDEPPTKIIEIPHLLSILATGTWDGQVQGMNEVNEQYNQQFPQNGRMSYVPNVFVQYWAMRVMAYAAGLAALIGLWGVFLLWRRRLDTARIFLWCATWAVFLPFFMGTAGWVLTENGRQPWIVQGLMLTRDGLSTSSSALQVTISLTVFGLLYTA
ncbi:MAG TPA: cytochrome ubiquinol oxidase subunit I, partial [Candidatus Nanopelagicales bacterium]|nr:cytochrome ubiquinol oxidase subunit I [Candidatus Nanopelagicales bacterium]